ncbi:MAG TPA: protein kinase [Gemmatimonadaceae bacterium]|nr:protein kinase [Gemmatimonadaceae bacterium]
MASVSSLETLRPLAERYAIEGELGRGGMATVYLAEELKHQRKVAIKVLRPDVAASLGAERFLREIGIAARLAHPHIVPLIDSGDIDGLLYYVSPFVPGGSLRDRLLREGRLPPLEALRVTQEIGAGLDYAHRAGFVHRDVKPENVLFADGHALLADFGVARVCCDTQAESDEQTLTDAGLIVGTPEYMSPEQAAGDRELGTRSDVYSLGCLVYEMLTGEPPFHDSSARVTMARHVTEAPRSLRVLRAELPRAVDAVVAKALAKAPEQRWASVPEFVRELEAAITGPPELAGRATRAAGRSIAVLPFVNTSSDPENEYLSDGITDELIDALSKLNGLRVSSRTSVFAIKGKPLDVRAIGAMLGVTVVLEGTVRKMGDRMRVTAQLTSTDDGRLLWSQRYDRDAGDVFAVQDELAHTIVTKLRGTWLAELAVPEPKRGTANVTAYGLYLRGRWALNQRTGEMTAKAIEYFERAIAEDPNYALAYTGLSDAYALHVDYRSVPVTEGFERAKMYARRALEIDDTLAEAHSSLAWTRFIYDWDWDGAEREFRRAIELDPRYPTAHQWYASMLASQARHEESIVEAHTAQELDPGFVSIRRGLGYQYYYARRYERARYHLERAIEMNPTAEETYRILGLVLSMEGKHGDAVSVLREAIGLPGAGGYTAATLGYALARANKREEAERICADLESRAEREYVSPAALSVIRLGLGEFGRALDWMERAHAERRGWLAYLAVNPIFDPLRAEPRFVALVRAMRLPEGPAQHG